MQARLWDVRDARKIGVSRSAHGLAFSYPVEFGVTSPAAGLAAREVLWWAALPGPQALDAHAGPAHGLRERALPEYGRVLGARRGYLHDPGRGMYARLRVLRRPLGQASRPTG